MTRTGSNFARKLQASPIIGAVKECAIRAGIWLSAAKVVQLAAQIGSLLVRAPTSA